MATRVRLIVEKFSANPKRLFRLDGFGALLTAFLLVAILARFESIFGMPRTTLYFLSSVAFMYAIYSWSCSFFISGSWPPYLKAIAIANTLYCCVTLALIFYFYQRLTLLGIIYFSLEIVVVIALVFIEFMVISTSVGKKSCLY